MQAASEIAGKRENDTLAPTRVGSLAANCCRAAVDILSRNRRGARGTQTSVQSGERASVLSILVSLVHFVFYFAADRTVAVEAKHREMSFRLKLYRRQVTAEKIASALI